MRHLKTILLILAFTAGLFLFIQRPPRPVAAAKRNAPEDSGSASAYATQNTLAISSPGDPAMPSKTVLMTPDKNPDGVWTSRTPAARRVAQITPDSSWMTPEPVLKAGDQITLPLFKDTILNAEISNVTRYPNGAVGITAHLQNGRTGTAFLSYCDGQMRASVQIPGESSYYVRYNPDTGTHYAIEVDPENTIKREGDDIVIPPADEAHADLSESGSATEPTAPADAPAGSTLVDVMIVYTPAALAIEGNVANMNANIALAMQKANEVHTNSNTQIYLRLVHSAQVPYTESGNDGTDLDRLTNTGDGYMDEVHTWRNSYGADFVCLFSDTATAGGLGWLLTSPSGRPEYAFCLARVQQTDWTYTVVHEWGHNMGCSHSKTQTSQPWESGDFRSYSAGWQWDDTKAKSVWPNTQRGYCSVMTYEDFDNDGTQDYERVAHFSNPSINYTDNSTSPTGNAADGDNARTIREMKSILASYRSEVVLPSVTLSLSGSPMAEGGGTATATAKATLSETYTQPVTVYLSFSGTASINIDYIPLPTSITIPEGSLTNSITLTAIQDTVYEGDETIIVDISSVANGTENGTQQVTATITDDEPQLLISPSNSVTFRSTSGGATSPSNQVYTLTNAGPGTISWTAVSTNSRAVLSATNGALASGATTNVTLTINSTGLAVGDYAGSITFFDTTHSDSLARLITLTVTPTYVYFFPLDTDPGWPRNGQWTFGQPTGQGNTSGGSGSKDPVSGATGTNVFGVNLNGDYVKTVGGPYYLTAGPFSFSGYTNVILYFQRWLNTDYPLMAPSTVDISTNGTTWTQLYINSGGVYDSAWTQCIYNISSLADRQSAVYVRWGYAVLNTAAQAESGWNIDDIGFTGDAIPSPDTDGDGIPNEWELQYFGGTTNANPDAIAANGTNTVMEAYIAGINPTNPAAFFTASLTNTNELVISWTAVSGRVYSVRGTTNLLNSFQTLETNILWPQSSWTDIVHNTEGSSFYKVDVQLAP